MPSFAYPWLVLLLPLPLVVYFWMPRHREQRPALRVPFFARLVTLTGAKPEGGAVVGRRGLRRSMLLTLCWLLAVAALMRPQWIEPPLHFDKPARDLLLLVDLSGSMDTQDFTDANGATVNRLTAVKQVLLAGDVVVGVGNIYASEALFQAGIRPTLSAARISRPRAAKLHAAVREILARAVEKGGSTLRDFSNVDGQNGYFQLEATVYGRAGEPCRVCATPIRQLRQGQRSTYFCPNCQK